MTYQQDFTLPTEILEQISEQGFEFLPALIQLIVDDATYAERQQYLQNDYLLLREKSQDATEKQVEYSSPNKA